MQTGKWLRRRKCKRWKLSRGRNKARELILKQPGQEYAQVVEVITHGRLKVNCLDNKQRLCRTRGKIRSKVKFRNGDIILTSLRNFEDAKADVLLKYNLHEAKKLKAFGELPDDLKLNEGDDGFRKIFIDFGKVHGSLTRPGKVKAQTPHVEKKKKKRKMRTGRAARRILYNKRFINAPIVSWPYRKSGSNSKSSTKHQRSENEFIVSWRGRRRWANLGMPMGTNKINLGMPMATNKKNLGMPMATNKPTGRGSGRRPHPITLSAFMGPVLGQVREPDSNTRRTINTSVTSVTGRRRQS